MRPRLVLSAIFLWALTAQAQQAEPMVAVLPFSAHALDADAVEGIGSAMGSELIHTGKFRVMERTQIDAILREQGFQQTGACDGSDCAVQVGKILSVDQMVLGTIAKVGGTYTLTARLVDVRTGEVLKSSTRNSRAEVDALLTGAIPLVAKDLAGIPVSKSPSPGGESDVSAKSHWGWWVAGGALVAGGAVAAVVLLDGKKSTSGGNSQTVQVVVP
jgi:TolB-like protein